MNIKQTDKIEVYNENGDPILSCSNFADDKDWTKGASVTMSDIPEDVMDVAAAVRDDATECETHVDWLERAIARAILAERERCARIADEEEDRNLDDDGARAAGFIAERIRSGEQP